jgi:hypothetical protein
MAFRRRKTMAELLQELRDCSAQRDKELQDLRELVARLISERDELLAQLQFANQQANHETRAAASFRAQLLTRTSAPEHRVDFCSEFDEAETTAVLPEPSYRARRPPGRARGDETERCIRNSA